MGVLKDLQSRGVKDVYLFCVDGLNGFQEAIAAAYPKAGKPLHHPPDSLQHEIYGLEGH